MKKLKNNVSIVLEDGVSIPNLLSSIDTLHNGGIGVNLTLAPIQCMTEIPEPNVIRDICNHMCKQDMILLDTTYSLTGIIHYLADEFRNAERLPIIVLSTDDSSFLTSCLETFREECGTIMNDISVGDLHSLANKSPAYIFPTTNLVWNVPDYISPQYVADEVMRILRRLVDPAIVTIHWFSED